MFEIVEFKKRADGKVVGKRLSRRDGPIIFPPRNVDVPLYYPRIVRLDVRNNHCVAWEVVHFEPVSTSIEWQTAQAKGNLLLAGPQGNIVVLSPTGSIRWAGPPQGLGPYPLAVDWLDDQRSLGVAVMLGDPMGELRPLYMDALHAHYDIHTRIHNETEKFKRARMEQAENSGELTYGEVEVHSDWHPYREDYEPWAPPLPPNATKHKAKVIASGHDVIDRIKAEAEEYRARLLDANKEDLDRTEREMQSIKERLQSFCDAHGLAVPPIP